MHRNPVVRGLVQKPKDWAWSSFRHYATGMGGTVEIESFWTGWQREHGAAPSQCNVLTRALDLGHPPEQDRP